MCHPTLCLVTEILFWFTSVIYNSRVHDIQNELYPLSQKLDEMQCGTQYDPQLVFETFLTTMETENASYCEASFHVCSFFLVFSFL